MLAVRGVVRECDTSVSERRVGLRQRAKRVEG